MRLPIFLCVVFVHLSAQAAAKAGPNAAHKPAACGEPLLAVEPREPKEVGRAFREHYVKYEYRIPMRDGVRLYTVAYVPKDRSRAWPIMLNRTPYAVTYGADTFPEPKTLRDVARMVHSSLFLRDGFIFVHQDVRGRMMSEGTFVDVRPAAAKGGVDEATDAWDTVDFLVKNVPANDGSVGVWGISYPGFYAAQAAIDAHPAVKAVSPQAPVTDWYIGDDFHHNGALFLQSSFSFMASFGKPRPSPTRKATWGFDYESGDAYEFFLNLGPLGNANRLHLKNEIAFWNDVMAHPNYDAYWKARNPLPRYKAVKPAVLVVGGLLDAQNLWGALATYQAFESQSPSSDVRLVLGPWGHGGWVRTEGDRLGDISFHGKTARAYQERIALPFFRRFLKGCPEPLAAEAQVFETGTNLFQTHTAWPPKEARSVTWYFGPKNSLRSAAPSVDGFDEWVSDPAKPVPHRGKPSLEENEDFVVEDQRFAGRRPDVVVHESPALTADLTVTGKVEASLWVSTSGTDSDFVVKLIDVYPADFPNPEPNPGDVHLGGYQQLVRAEVFRGRFRKSFEKPEAFVPGQPTLVRFTLPDISHTFRPGHRVMVQVQSSWFPLVDRNPQTFVDIATAKESDFKAATQRLYFSREHPSSMKVPVLRGALERAPD
jgi:putative CocE/NonD family hydrolase